MFSWIAIIIEALKLINELLKRHSSNDKKKKVLEIKDAIKKAKVSHDTSDLERILKSK